MALLFLVESELLFVHHFHWGAIDIAVPKDNIITSTAKAKVMVILVFFSIFFFYHPLLSVFDPP